MRLYHATPQSNITSIQANGLDPNRATGKESHIGYIPPAVEIGQPYTPANATATRNRDN